MSKAENLKRLKETNTIGASSQNWLRDVAKVLNRRFDTEGRDRPLIELARAGCEREVWDPLLLWHITRDEFLLRDFLVRWLYGRYLDGTFRLRTGDVLVYLDELPGKRAAGWSDATRKRVAAGLLHIATDFGLLTGSQVREFASYHLPEASFLYLLHAMAREEANARRLIESEEWRMFLMAPEDVEREVLRLHQFRRLHYERAGSLVRLDLPCGSPEEFAREMAA